MQASLGGEEQAVGDPFTVGANLVDVSPQVSCGHQSVDGDFLHGCDDGRKICVGKLTQELAHRPAAGRGSVVPPSTTPLSCHGATVAGSAITTAQWTQGTVCRHKRHPVAPEHRDDADR